MNSDKMRDSDEVVRWSNLFQAARRLHLWTDVAKRDVHRLSSSLRKTLYLDDLAMKIEAAGGCPDPATRLGNNKAFTFTSPHGAQGCHSALKIGFFKGMV